MLHPSPLGEDDTALATPAVAGKKLLLSGRCTATTGSLGSGKIWLICPDFRPKTFGQWPSLPTGDLSTMPITELLSSHLWSIYVRLFGELGWTAQTVSTIMRRCRAGRLFL